MTIKKIVDEAAAGKQLYELGCREMAEAIIQGLKDRATLKKHGNIRDGGAKMELTMILRQWRFPIVKKEL